jgi:hypothetical protein
MSRRKRPSTPIRPAPLSAAEASVKVARINRSTAIGVAIIGAGATVLASAIGVWVLHGG